MKKGINLGGVMVSPTALAAIISLIVIAAAFTYSLASVTAAFGRFNAAPSGPGAQGASTSVNLTIIAVPGCATCEGFADILSALDQTGLNYSLKRMNFTDSAARTLAAGYGVEKFPALIVEGRSNQTDALALVVAVKNRSTGYAVEPAVAPYYSVRESRLVGIVNMLVVTDAACANCTNISEVAGALQNAQVTLGNVTTVDYSSADGAAYARQFNVTRLPFAVIGSDISYYPETEAQVAQLSRNLSGTYVLEAPAPYRELATGSIRGLVEAVYLVDSTCLTCYNISLHETAFKNLGVMVASSMQVEMAGPTGRALIQKYNITTVPTVLLSPETSVYPFMAEAWASVGTIEADGWYVFRNASLAGTYRNVSNNAIVNATGAGS